MTITKIDKTARLRNDCVLIAFSTYFNIPYEDVLIDLTRLSLQTGIPLNIDKEGVPYTLSEIYLFKRGLYLDTVPRRNQIDLLDDCIISLHNGSQRVGHMICIKNHLVYDDFEPNGCPLDVYKVRHHMLNVRKVYRVK